MKWIACLFLLIQLPGFAQNRLSLTSVTDKVNLLPATFINTSHSERDFALSPDGSELFYTIQTQKGVFQTLLHSKKLSNGSWTNPTIASFAGNYSDLEPAFSADGKKLYFASNRPINGSEPKDFDIWVVEKKNGVWGSPTNLGPTVNSSQDEFYPSIAASGNLYFTAAYTRGIGKEDIYMARFIQGSFEQPEPLDTSVNSKMYEFNAFVSQDEKYILFTAYGRKDDMGGGDLYLSEKGSDGKWKPARHLPQLNSNRLDYCPFISFDSKILFFTSERSNLKDSYKGQPVKTSELNQLLNSPLNGGGNIYWIKFSSILDWLK